MPSLQNTAQSHGKTDSCKDLSHILEKDSHGLFSKPLLSAARSITRLGLHTGAACASRATLARGVLLDFHVQKQHVPVFGGVRVDVYGKPASLVLELLLFARVEHDDG